ncbi:hypothetical protein Ddye_026639 [Dipteronia dyeriana]|uniref:RNase H type-1 domain-containing protein n=1 Tax=Dipteronia dyeriana TaxID=168575 RepID=A0AAD9TMJ1_9ROSI|nr:hypothetical protein Ddye_026639 [Dipteronia dyeriana]
MEDVWSPPHFDLLKFNVDGLSMGMPGPTGIGGVLRDFNGKVLCIFSIYIGIQDSNMAEVAAILKACELCASNPTLADNKITIASDSKVVISWIKNKEFGSFSYLNILYNIKSLLHDLGDVEVCYNPRSTNSFADKLANMGSANSGDRISWGDL